VSKYPPATLNLLLSLFHFSTCPLTSMSTDLQQLIDLQNLETAIEEAKRRIAAHPQRIAEADARLAHATEALDTTRQRLKASQDARREQEKEAATFQSRLSKFKDQ